MDILKLKKLRLNKYLVISLVMCFCNFSKISADVDETLDWDSLVHAEYQYELVETSKGGIDCSGKFIVTVTTTDENLLTDLKQVSCSSSYGPAIRYFKEVTGPDVVFEFKRLLWKQYFSVSFWYNDGTLISSPTLKVADYMDEEDLERLLTQDSVENVEAEPVNLEVKNRQLYIDTQDSITLDVFGMNGNLIVSKQCSGESVISLEDVKDQIIVVKYANSNFSKTRKFILR